MKEDERLSHPQRNNRSDAEWSEGFKRQDTASLEAAIDVFGPAVRALVFRVLSGAGGAEDAEECVSDVFLAAWKGIDRFDAERAGFRTWLLILAKYKALDIRRKLLRTRDKTVALADEPTLSVVEELMIPSAEANALSREESRELLGHIEGLEEPDRSLFWRRYFYYESLEELAEAFGFSKRAVESRLYRCRLMLRQALGRSGNGLKGGQRDVQ